MALPSSLQAAVSAVVDNGARKAAESLGRMSGAEWRRVSSAIESFSGLPKAFAGAGNCYGVYVDWNGGASLMFILEHGALALARSSLFRTIDPGVDFLDRRDDLMARLGEAKVAEIGNVMAHSVATAWADACDTGFILSAPQSFHLPGPELRERLTQRLAKDPGGFELSVSIEMACDSVPIVCLMGAFVGSALIQALPRPGSRGPQP